MGSGCTSRIDAASDELVQAAREDDVHTIRGVLKSKKLLDRKVTFERHTLLQVAAMCGSSNVAGFLIGYKATLAIGDDDGETALHLAVADGGPQQLKVAELLLQARAAVAARSSCGKLPLHMAARRGHLEAVKLLLSAKTPVDTGDELGDTPLHEAAGVGAPEVIQELIHAQAQPDQKNRQQHVPLHKAATWSQDRAAELLLRLKAQPALPDERGSTPLHQAALSGSLPVAQRLFLVSAPVHAQDRQQRTPLHLAASEGHGTVVRCLLEMGAQDCPDGFGNTALHLAAQSRSSHAVEAIAAMQAVTALVNLHGRTALHEAARGGSAAIFKRLTAAGLSTEVMDADGCRPLHLGVQHQEGREFVDAVLAAKGQVDSQRKDGLTALGIAAQAGNSSAAEYLLQNGANVGTADLQSNTPLHFAAFHGHLPIVQALLTRRASVNRKNADGQTPFQLAGSSGHVQAAAAMQPWLERAAPPSPSAQHQMQQQHALQHQEQLRQFEQLQQQQQQQQQQLLLQQQQVTQPRAPPPPLESQCIQPQPQPQPQVQTQAAVTFQPPPKQRNEEALMSLLKSPTHASRSSTPQNSQQDREVLNRLLSKKATTAPLQAVHQPAMAQAGPAANQPTAQPCDLSRTAPAGAVQAVHAAPVTPAPAPAPAHSGLQQQQTLPSQQPGQQQQQQQPQQPLPHQQQFPSQQSGLQPGGGTAAQHQQPQPQQQVQPLPPQQQQQQQAAQAAPVTPAPAPAQQIGHQQPLPLQQPGQQQQPPQQQLPSHPQQQQQLPGYQQPLPDLSTSAAPQLNQQPQPPMQVHAQQQPPLYQQPAPPSQPQPGPPAQQGHLQQQAAQHTQAQLPQQASLPPQPGTHLTQPHPQPQQHTLQQQQGHNLQPSNVPTQTMPVGAGAGHGQFQPQALDPMEQTLSQLEAELQRGGGALAPHQQPLHGQQPQLLQPQQQLQQQPLQAQQQQAQPLPQQTQQLPPQQQMQQGQQPPPPPLQSAPLPPPSQAPSVNAPLGSLPQAQAQPGAATGLVHQPAVPATPAQGVPASAQQPQQQQPQHLAPKPSAIMFKDPRDITGKDVVGLVAFYFPGHEEPWDTLCGGAFLSNFYDLRPTGMEVLAKDKKHTFMNGEAAFQALKFWHVAHEFASLSGQDAFYKKTQLQGQEDFTYAGLGSNWQAMRTVLNSKFVPHSRWADALQKTGDSFLLEHNATTGRDKVWSDNCDGEGTNWLGMQLMLIRDKLAGKRTWQRFINGLVDIKTGSPLSQAAKDTWQEAVRNAAKAVQQELGQRRPGGSPQPQPLQPQLQHQAQQQQQQQQQQPPRSPSRRPTCSRVGCSKPTWNGEPNEYCSRACKDASAGAGSRPVCLRPGCGKLTIRANEYCSISCRREAMRPDALLSPGSTAHNTSGVATPNAGTTLPSSRTRGPVCLKAGCGKPTWNGSSGEYCSSCRPAPRASAFRR